MTKKKAMPASAAGIPVTALSTETLNVRVVKMAARQEKGKNGRPFGDLEFIRSFSDEEKAVLAELDRRERQERLKASMEALDSAFDKAEETDLRHRMRQLRDMIALINDWRMEREADKIDLIFPIIAESMPSLVADFETLFKAVTQAACSHSYAQRLEAENVA
jgi:hypothetical protein